MAGNKSLLSPEELSSLVEGLDSGEVDTSPLSDSSSKAVKAYSLVSTDTTSRSQLAALEMINDRTARQLRGSLLTLLRQAIKVTVVPFEVTTFGEHLKSIPTPANVNIVRFPPLRGYGLITISTQLVYGAVDSFFGGHGGSHIEPSPQRAFTPTETRIISLLLECVFAELKDAWSPVYEINPEYVSSEINPSFAQVGEDKDTVVVCSFDVELAATVVGRIQIMYPFSALKPIRLLLRGRLQTGERDEKQAEAWSRLLEDAVMDAELTMVGQLSTFRMPAPDLAGIKVGDTLWFKQPQHVRVLVQSDHLFDAEYGSVDGQAALRIQAKAPAPKATPSQPDTQPNGSTSQVQAVDKPSARSGSRAA